MRKFFSYSIAAIAALSLVAFTAGISFADSAVTGSISSAFGQYTAGDTVEFVEIDADGDGMPDYDANGWMYSEEQTTKGSTGWKGDGQADLNFSGGSDIVTAKAKIRVREDGGGGLTKYRSQVDWKVTDALTLQFQGRGFGVSGAAVANGIIGVGTFGTGMDIGGNEANLASDVGDMSGIDVTYNMGNMAFGLAIFDSCKLTCDGSIGEDQTMVPHFNGTFGAIGVGVHMVQSSAAAADGSKDDPGASETSIQVAYTAEGMEIGFEYVMNSENVNYDGDQDGVNDSVTTVDGGGMGLGVKVAGVEFHYIDTNYDLAEMSYCFFGTCTAANTYTVSGTGGGITEIAVAYKMALTDSATAYPMFAQTTYKGMTTTESNGTTTNSNDSVGDTKDATDQYVGFGIKVSL